MQNFDHNKKILYVAGAILLIAVAIVIFYLYTLSRRAPIEVRPLTPEQNTMRSMSATGPSTISREEQDRLNEAMGGVREGSVSGVPDSLIKAMSAKDKK